MKNLLSFIALWSVFGLYSQNASISGIIKSKKKLKPISDATIICKTVDNIFIKGSTSDSNGSFTLEKLPQQKIKLLFQFLGYKEKMQLVDLTKNPKINLKSIYLEEDITLIEAVEIKTDEPLMIQKIDRKVYNVQKDLQSIGGNSLDVLQNIPSVNVDVTTGSISLRGSNAKVLINGKPSSQNIRNTLEMLPSSSIKSIEVMTNPPAKYTAEGMSGIINIILKKNNKIGFNGTARAGIKHSLNTQYETGLTLNYQKGKLNLFSEYSYDNGKRNVFYDIERLDKDLKQDIDFLNTDESHYFKIGADVYLNKKNTLSFYTVQNFSDNDLLTKTKVINNATLSFDANSLSVYNYSDQLYNINYLIDFNEEGKSLEFEFNYSEMKEPENNITSEQINPTFKDNNYAAIINDKSTQWLANIDYTTPLKNGSFETGLAYRYQNFSNKINTTQEYISNLTPLVFSPIGNTILDYKRNIFSAYINTTKEINQWAFQLGLRLEQFDLDAQFKNTEQGNTTITDNLLSVFPSAYINYTLNEKNSLQLTYSRRIDRPSIDQITPIQEWNSPLSVSIGNVNLVPQLTNSLELNYTKTFKKNYLTFGLYYRIIDNYIDTVINNSIETPDRQEFSSQNYDTANSYGFDLSGRLKLKKWWYLYPSFELYYKTFDAQFTNNSIHVNNVLSKVRLSNSLRIHKRFRINVSGVFNGERETIQYKVDPFTYFNFSASLKILNNKGRLTFRATDIFNAYNFDFSSQRPSLQLAAYQLELNAVSLNFNYKFGSGKNKPKNRKYRDTYETEKGLF